LNVKMDELNCHYKYCPKANILIRYIHLDVTYKYVNYKYTHLNFIISLIIMAYRIKMTSCATKIESL